MARVADQPEVFISDPTDPEKDLLYVRIQDELGNPAFSYIAERHLYNRTENPANPSLGRVSKWGAQTVFNKKNIWDPQTNDYWTVYFHYSTGGDYLMQLSSFEEADDYMKRHVRWHYEYYQQASGRYTNKERSYDRIARSALYESDTPLPLCDFDEDRILEIASPVTEEELELAKSLFQSRFNRVEYVIYAFWVDELHTIKKYKVTTSDGKEILLEDDPRGLLYSHGYSLDYGYWRQKAHKNP